MKPAEKGTPKEELKKQGQALLHVAKENGIELEKKLQTALRNGYRNGLTEAQRQIRSAIWDGRQEIAYQNAEKGMRETANRYRQRSITRAEAERSIQSHISGFFGSGDNVIDGNRMDRLRNLADSILEENPPAKNVASEATNEGRENSAQNPTFQDRVNDLRGNPKGTRVESVKASEIASIINSAGERSAQNQDSSSNRNSIAANERESYQAAYDRMQKAREDYRSGKMPAAKAREEINAAYGQYARGTFVMDARHHHNLRDMVEGFEKEDVERATSGKSEPARQEDTDGHMEWIRQNPFVYDNSKSVDENLARAEKMAKEYMQTYGETSKIDTPERKELRQNIIDELYGDGAERKEGQVFLVIGLPASGKSSAVAEPVAKANGALIVDSDMAKERLPEFSNGLLANAVHDESSKIADEITAKAMSNNDNIVLPLVGRTEGKLQEKIDKLKSTGYTVHLLYVDLPTEKAVERGKGRFKNTGRLVPIDYIRSVGLNPKANYDKIKTREGVDYYAAWSNDVGYRTPPRFLEAGPGRLSAEDWLGGRGFNSRKLDGNDGQSNRLPEGARNDTQSSEGVGSDGGQDSGSQNGVGHGLLKSLQGHVSGVGEQPGRNQRTLPNSGRTGSFEREVPDGSVHVDALGTADTSLTGVGLRRHSGLHDGEKTSDNEITQSKHSESQGASSIGEESAQKQEGKKEDSIFGSIEDADREMFEALGITPEDAENEELSFTNEFGDTTDEEIEALKKELSKELNKLSANPVFNPRVYSLGLQLGGKYIQKGYRTFKKWLDKMRGDLGENIEPWAPAIWETLKTYPKGQKFDSKQVMAVSRAIGARYERGMTAIDDIQKDFTKNMSASNKKTFAKLIEASYNGIRKFFDEREAARNGEETRRNVETGQGESQGTSGGYRDVESGEVSGADEERGRGGTERTAATPGSEPQSRSRDEAGDTRTDGRSGDAGGSGRKRVGSKDDRSGNGAGSNQQSVLKEDPSKDGDKPAEVPGHNFHITKASGIGEGGEKTKFKQNIEAIKLLKKLEAEGRRATPEEQAILAKFNGWGTVKSAFSNSKDWEKEYAQLKELLTPEEYKEAASASLNAFYTSPEVVNAIWKGVERLGFKGGRVLDPSMGTGNFFGMMPLDMANASSLHGVEKDSLTGRLAKQLYQKADVQVAGFEETSLPNNFFDLAISNVPFGETTPFDRAYEKTSTGENVRYRIHNYFFAKAMDKVRPGGLVAFITGPGTMQTTSKEANLLRLEMGRKADLVAAFKLPGSAFEKNAGTSVTTDVLILQKRVNPRQPAKYAQKWDEVGTINIKDPQRSGIYDYGTNFNLNEYYQKHPDNMIGKPVADKLYGQRDRMGLDGKGLDVGKELSKRMGKLPKDIYAPAKVRQHSTPESTKKFLSDPGTLERSYVMKDGKPYQNIGGELNEVPAKSAKAVEDYCKLRSALNAVLKAQIDPAASDAAIEKLRKDLNLSYDSFVKKHGYVNAKKNVSALGDDPMYGQVAAVEKYEYDKDAKTEKASKTDIFTKRTVGAIREISSADSPTDALTASIAQMGKVDIPYMANLLGKSEKETIQALGDLVYENPSTGQQELAEEYLSGNVRAKLAEAETAAKTNPAYKRNVEALKKVQPVDYTEHDIKANIGAPWIPAEVYQGFTRHMVGAALEIKHEKLTNTWKVGTNWSADHTKMFNTWGTSSLPFNELLERILGMKEIQVKEKTKDGNTIVNTEATAEAVAKAEDVQAEFEKWLWSDEERKTELLKSYNKLFNSEVERNYDGSALTFPGLVSHIRGKLYPHQKNAIWRMMQGGNTLIAHCVGAGKTWEMQIAGMEMKRVGICRKPMYVVPNNIVEQFRKEFYETYPNAKLLVLTAKDLPGAKLGGGADTFTEKLDTTKHKETKGGKAQKKEKEEAGKRQERLNKRRAALSRIATEDWDGIIISHNLFTNLPMSPESYNEFYREQLDELDAAIRQMKSDEFGKMDKRSVTALENAKENLENRLKRDVSEDKKEVVIPFEELGIDQIFVDEADKFKNLAFHTSMGMLSGISTTNAKRSTDMYVKTRYMTKTYGRGIVFATGTPISNSMNEMYTMQRYLDADKLKDLGMNHFDSWAAMFGRKKDESEPSPDGNGFRMVTKLKFTNLQVLGKIYRSFADIKLPEDLPYLKRPKLKNGSRTVISVESTDAFDELKQTLVERTDAIRSGRPMTRTKKDGSTYEDNMLAVTNDFRTASLDMRLIDPTLSAEEAGAKVAALCDTVKRKYDETTPVSGAQVIFADIGTPKPQKDTGTTDDESVMVEETAENITVYDEIKKELIKRGIPANEIGFVHDGKNPTQRQALFEKVNEGKLRVFIGSTETMGAGTNFQHHLAALHHLDCPWKPRDVEQREGRILRAGNENPEVEIFTYVTKGSYDANMWDKVRYKQQMIDSVMRGDPAAEEMDDISSNSSAEYGDIEAIAMDNPLMAEKVNLDAEVMRLKSLESSYNKEQRRMRGELQKLPAQIEQAKADAGRASADIKDRVSTKGDDFRMQLGEKVYTKRADATKALEAIDKSFRKPVSTKIGEIGGFEIHMRFDQAYIENLGGGQVVHGRNVIQLVSHGSYTAEPSVSSMEYALSHAPEKALHGAETLLKKSEERLKGLNEEIGKPFKQKEQLDAAVKRQQEIQKQLDEANKPKEVQGNESTEKTEAQESTQAERDQNQDTESRPGEEAAGREVGNDIISKFSASGEIRKILAGIRMVDNEELNSQQRKISEIGEAMGVPVVWIDADSRLNGFHQKGVTFLNRKAGMSLQKTFWHEQFHWLRNNNDDLWRELLTYFKGKDAFSKKQIEAYQKKTGRYDLTSDEAVIEEMLADAFMDVSRRVPIMKELARDDRSLAQKLVAWIKDMMNRFVEMFHNPEGRLTTEQRDIFVEAFGKLARDMVDADGKKIFKTYDDGKTIRLADGSELAGVRLSTGKKKFSIDNSEKMGDNEVTRQYRDIPTRAQEFVSNELNNPGLAHRVTSSDDIDSVCDKVVAPLKEMAEVILDRNQRTNDPIKKERMLNQAAFFVGMVDEIRRDFNAGGRVYEIVSRSGLVRGQAREGSNLAESLRYRGREIAEASRAGKEIGVKIAGAVDGFSGRHQSIVDDIRKQDRGDGVKFSVNMNSETTEGRSESQDASSIGENERGWFDRIYERFGKSAGIKAGKIIVEEREKGSNDIGLADYVAGSPSRIAEKVKMFRQFFHMGDKAMNTLTKNRSDFARKLEQAMNLVKNKEDREDLFNVLLIGDAEGKEYTKQQLMEEEGVNGNVADAYIRIRRLMTKAYRMVNDAKRRPQMHSRRMTDKEIMDLKDNKFVEIKSVHEAENGKKLVSYKEYANWEKSYTVDAETLERFEQDDAMQVLGYEQNEDGSYTVDVREAVPPVNKLTGYIPHFFHDYMIRVKDADGNYVATIGSGRTENDAIKKAEAWLKKNELEDGQQVYIAPKAFSFDSLGMDEGQYAAVMGDTDFDRMMNSIAEKNDMTLAEAKEMMKGSVKKKNRHRFFGNLLHRKGVAGYEQDLNWVLRHYFNSASRYAAMETEFKPKAISLFERYFGDFNKDHTGLAKYTKDYINDINGNPTALEDAINKSLNKSELWRKLAVSNFGDRAALQLANTVTNWTSMLCLGYLNASSAILNFTQAINATAYLGSMAAGGDIFRYGFKRKYGLKDMHVLVETNVMNDIGLDSGSGYDTNRGYAGKALGALGWVSNKGMVLFKLSEGAMRRGTVLAAYHKAINEGKSHAEAIAYAKEINRKSNFDYGVADAPNIFRRGSIISQLALQFKKYAFKELEVMGDFLPMLSKDTNRKQKLLFWGMYFLACGLLQVPAIDWLDKLLGENMKDFVQKSIMEAAGDSEAGKLLAKTAMYGLPAIGGIDISNRAGMADVVPSKPTDIFGPSLNKTASLISDLAKGDGAAAIRDVSPGIYNQYTAWIAGESTGSRGRINNRYDSFYDKALKSIGFKSTDERIASDIQRITYNERSRLTKEKQAAVDEYLANPTTENAMKLRELGVKPDTVKKERERKKADRLGRVQAGMSKEERERYGDLMKFAE